MTKTLNEQAADLLEAAGAVLWLPEWWTKGLSASNERGKYVGVSAEEACKFCASGALSAARFDGGRYLAVYLQAVAALNAQTGGDFVVFNDDRAQSSREVATAMFLAADKLRGQA